MLTELNVSAGSLTNYETYCEPPMEEFSYQVTNLRVRYQTSSNWLVGYGDSPTPYPGKIIKLALNQKSLTINQSKLTRTKISETYAFRN